ncbi:N-acetylmuramic acid 6-phosphate etherase [Sphingosinicella sp. BN140058]|uniref:N-acetylmuramic acid 6-phosphate etherase n=1 Tax=Sphingosinicella sp. BN140058 TaxID=1892855 RepID=UPI0010120013|nr:N-acetylmuramic acid 6-phosphate etherase [Sphingosinicella sp. BN140058]QAY76191.1 N-acetylmuramic acid 6-phosphate etherase [Sphingosinicella sp. BN140058]
MSTELISARFADLDLWPSQDAVQAMLEGQLAAVAAVQSQTSAIAAAADAAAGRLRGGRGRLIYAGAGTSGRLAVLDGVELAPTYDWGAERTGFALAGGMAALTVSVEGAEDDATAGEAAIRALNPTAEDVVIGVAASGRTPYTVAAVRAGDAAGALTVGIASNAGTPLLAAAAHPILLDTGAEVVAGSTRMKAGTAQKIALNLLSSTIMLRLGRVYRGLMVDMRLSNRKLRDRAVTMVSEISGVSRPKAEAALERAGGRIKPAALVALGVDPAAAATILRDCGDDLRQALERFQADTGVEA